MLPRSAWASRISLHVPGWLDEVYKPVRFAAGCYRVESYGQSFLWIAANELPLCDELVPFLVARSGSALDEFARWVSTRRSLEWVLSMLKYLAMSTAVRKELFWNFGPTDEPEILDREQQIIEILLAKRPEMKKQIVDEGVEKGRLNEARAMLRRVLATRKLSLSAEQQAQIDACEELPRLERWLEQAITASSAKEALR